MTTPEFTLLENGLRKPFLDMVKKYGKQKYTLWTIWTYMKWRSSNDFFTLPENLVREDLGIDINVLRAARAILVKEGWLKKDVLRDTGGEYLTRTWLVTAPPSVYHSLGTEPPRVFTTEGKSPYSGSCSDSCSGSPSPSSSCAATPSDSSKSESPKGVPQHNEKIGPKSKPENLEPKPTPVGLHGQKTNGQAKKVRYAPDGTPWPNDFDSWTNGERLQWLGAHGWEQDRGVDASSQETVQVIDRYRNPTSNATPLLNPPSSAVPPNGYCPQCSEPDDFCYCQRPVSIETTAPLDNWEEL